MADSQAYGALVLSFAGCQGCLHAHMTVSWQTGAQFAKVRLLLPISRGAAHTWIFVLCSAAPPWGAAGSFWVALKGVVLGQASVLRLSFSLPKRLIVLLCYGKHVAV